MSTERNTIRHVKKKDRAAPPENYSTEGAENVAQSGADFAIMRREEMLRRYTELRRAFFSFEKFMRDTMNFDLNSK